MINGFLAYKLKMSQAFLEDGVLAPVTVLKAEPCFVIRVDLEKKRIQIGAGKKRKINRALEGYLKKNKVKTAPFLIKEFDLSKDLAEGEKLNSSINANQVFQEGDIIDVAGLTKGRGFAGVIKRWSFSRQPKTHGQSDRERAPGSIGAQTPGRVLKGKKMPGHLGAEKRTIKNLTILKIDDKNNEIYLKGSVPGWRKSWLILKPTGKKAKKFSPIMEKKKEENGEKKDSGEK